MKDYLLMERIKTYKEKKEQEEREFSVNQQILGSLIARSQLFYRLGMSYNDERDLYKALGYKLELTFDDFYQQFRRQDIANAVINRPAKATWRGDLEIIESDDDEETPLEKEWKKLNKELKLKNKFLRVDKLTGIGNYGILLLGTNDVETKEDFIKPITTSKLRLMYIKPVSEKNAEIKTYADNPNDPRYGLPLIYEITLAKPNDGTSTETVLVHHSRVIHVIDEQLESEIEGIPRLEDVFNRLKDLEKLVGGSAEMFWRGARPGYAGEVDENYQMTPAVKEQLREQIDEYENYLRRFLTLEGVKLKELTTQVSDPKGHVDVQIQMISAATGIPKRILTGSERGELSSTQDQDEWDAWVKNRREEFAEPQIIHPFVDWCIKYKVLPEPKDEYTVQWEDLFAQSDKEKAEVGRIRAEALKAYVANPVVESIFPPDAFFEFMLGLNGDQIELVKKMLEAHVQEEQNQVQQIPEEDLNQVEQNDNNQTE